MSFIERTLVSLARLSNARYLLLLLLVAGFYYFSYYNDGSGYDRQLQSLRQELQKERAIAEETQALIAEKEAILNTRDQLALEYVETLKALPTEIDVADILRGINRTAKLSGIKINSLSPSQLQSREFYDQLPISIESEGQFAELALFLSYIARMPRIIRIVDFEIATPRTRRRVVSEQSPLLLKGKIMAYRAQPQALQQESNGQQQRSSQGGRR